MNAICDDLTRKTSSSSSFLDYEYVCCSFYICSNSLWISVFFGHKFIFCYSRLVCVITIKRMDFLLYLYLNFFLSGEWICIQIPRSCTTTVKSKESSFSNPTVLMSFFIEPFWFITMEPQKPVHFLILIICSVYRYNMLVTFLSFPLLNSYLFY